MNIINPKTNKMKRTLKSVILTLVAASATMTAITILFPETQRFLWGWLAATGVCAGVLGAIYSLIKFSWLQTPKIVETQRPGGMWNFLWFFVIEAIMGAACIYLVICCAGRRGILNFELMLIVSGLLTYCITHMSKKENKAPAKKEEK